jgi:hypothetical protein
MEAGTSHSSGLDEEWSISMPTQKPCFLITIDTEGDNLWAQPREVTTHNAAFLSRFQSLCEKYQLKPTYLTNYEMAKSECFVEFGHDVIKRNTGEIGMHLHAWNSPPIIPLTDDDTMYQPYLIEYADEIMHKKIVVMTDLLEEVFQIKMVSHRAGRWAFDERYARMLAEQQYLVDCSVTPHVSWKHTLGDPRQNGGTDYTRFTNKAYFVDLDNISRAGNSKLLEVPLTVMEAQRPLHGLIRSLLHTSTMGMKLLKRFYPTYRLRPDGSNKRLMLSLIQQILDEKRDFAEFMLHSSELMPGCSPTFSTAYSIEKLYDDMEVLFSQVSQHFVGATLKEYYDRFNRSL